MKNYKILCLIPARSGSKGIPHKNIKLLQGKPLLAHSIEQAQSSSYAKDMRIVLIHSSLEFGSKEVFRDMSDAGGYYSRQRNLDDKASEFPKAQNLIVQLQVE